MGRLLFQRPLTLSYGGKSVSKDFTFKIKPELEATGITVADLKEQEELALQAAELLLSIKSKIREFETKIEKTNSKLKKEALEIRLQTLKKGPRRYDKPMIHEHVEYLYDMVTNSPQKLGEDAFERYLQLKNEYEGMR